MQGCIVIAIGGSQIECGVRVRKQLQLARPEVGGLRRIRVHLAGVSGFSSEPSGTFRMCIVT